MKIIEEGLLKPMTDADIEQVEDEKVTEILNGILLRSTKNADGSIDVDGDVDLFNLNLKKLPLKFNRVNGNFDCYKNQLTSLEGAPNAVGGDFYCSFNQLISLEGVPKKVGRDFWIGYNKSKFTEKQVRTICNVKGNVCV